MNKVLDKLPALIDEELQAAMDEHGEFHSLHEGYAVLLEEVEEMEKEVADVRSMLNLLWMNVKNDNVVPAYLHAGEIVKSAQNAAAEAIQVAAVALKIIGHGEAS